MGTVYYYALISRGKKQTDDQNDVTSNNNSDNDTTVHYYERISIGSNHGDHATNTDLSNSEASVTSNSTQFVTFSNKAYGIVANELSSNGVAALHSSPSEIANNTAPQSEIGILMNSNSTFSMTASEKDIPLRESSQPFRSESSLAETDLETEGYIAMNPVVSTGNASGQDLDVENTVENSLPQYDCSLGTLV